MWSILLLPINWSLPSEWWLTIGILILIGGCSAVLLAARPSSRRFWSAICFCLLAILPASHLALLDSRLNGSRVYHLALIGFALLIGVLFEGFRNQRIATLAFGAIVLFQMAALTHNLLIWRATAELAGQVCRTFPDSAAGDKTAFVSGLPNQYNGVFFLANGFSDCVFMNSGKRIQVDSSNKPSSSAEAKFHWDERSRSVIRQK